MLDDRFMISALQSRCFVLYSSDESGKLLYYKSREDLSPEGEILIKNAVFNFDPKEKPGIFEIRFVWE